MSWLDPECDPYDIKHIGYILALIRNSRGIKTKDLYSWGGPSVSTINRLEHEGTGERADHRYPRFERLLNAWQSPKNPRPLNQQQIKFLDKLYKYSDPEYVDMAEEKLKYIDLRIIDPVTGNPQLISLVKNMENSDLPAFIIGPLYFIYAVNGAALKLFGMSPSSRHFPYLNHWTSWHVVATKFHKDSLPRKAHKDPDLYFEWTTAEYLKDPHNLPYIFTKQMRAIRCRILKLSNSCQDIYQYSFQDLVDKALSFQQKSTREHIHRIISYKDRGEVKDIWIKPGTPIEKTLRIKQSDFTFVLHFWEPLGSEAELVFDQIRKSAFSKDIYFAFQYDKNNDFHVNNWRELRNLTSERVKGCV